MIQQRASNCLGFITGKCVHESGCKSQCKSECYPPKCEEMHPSHEEGMIFCGHQKETVDPWKVCLKCNPKDYL